MIYKSMK